MVRKLKNTLKNVNSLPNKKNVSHILNYYNYLLDKGITESSKMNNIQSVCYFARYLDTTNLTDVKEKHQITSYLNTFIKPDDPEKKYIGTWNSYRSKLIAFYRWLYNADGNEDHEENWTTPEFVKIKSKLTKRLSPYNQNEIWEKEELQSIIKYEVSTRNKAIISLLWDLDARPHEVTLLKIKNIRLREKYGEGEIPYVAKTGSGPILLTFSFPYVRDWLNDHPDRNNGEAPLICNQRNGKSIIPRYIYDVMERLKFRIKRLVISGSISDQREKERMQYFLNVKKWNPYCIRHSAITADSDYLPEYALKKKVRWSMNSKQGSRYIKNRMGDELRNKILEQNGIILNSELKPKPTITVCPRCELVNQIENKYCSKCSYPLTPQAFEEIKQEENSKIKELEEKQRKEIEEMKQSIARIMENVDFSKVKPKV